VHTSVPGLCRPQCCLAKARAHRDLASNERSCIPLAMVIAANDRSIGTVLPTGRSIINQGRSKPDVVAVSRPCLTPFIAIMESASFCTIAGFPRTRMTSRQLW
jgi:hypothetical protein